MFANYRFVNSTAIRFVAYDVPSATLRVIFQSGTGYDYANVPPNVYQSLAKAPSVGTYFGRHVRDRFPSERITDREVATFALSVAEAYAD